jgi:hypothetical protein
VLRLRALDRRRAHNRPPVREIAGLRLDPFRREVYRDGRYVPLTRKRRRRAAPPSRPRKRARAGERSQRIPYQSPAIEAGATTRRTLRHMRGHPPPRADRSGSRNSCAVHACTTVPVNTTKLHA